jgi:multidrug efflux pump
MLGVTFFGLIFTPVFYVVIAKYMKRKQHVTGAVDITPEEA